MKKILFSSMCLAMLAISANAAHHNRISLGATSIDNEDASYFYNFDIDMKKYKENQNEDSLVYGVEIAIGGKTFDAGAINETTVYQADLGALGGYGLYLPIGGFDASVNLLGGAGFSVVGLNYKHYEELNKSESLLYVKAGASAIVNFGQKDKGVSLLAEGFLRHTFKNDTLELDSRTALELKSGVFYNMEEFFVGAEVGTKDIYWSKKESNLYTNLTLGYRF